MKETGRPRIQPHDARLERRGEALYMTSNVPLDPVAPHSGERLHHWATEAPSRTFLAERSGAGWREVSYAEALQSVRAITTSLAARGLGAETPIAILSGNGVDHALLSFAAQYAGIPTVPVAEQYSLIPEAHGRLAHVIGKVRPKLVFAEDVAQYAAALERPELENVDVVAVRTEGAPHRVTPFADLLRGDTGVSADELYDSVTPDSLAKILFTSGSSSDPKGVMTTQKMMWANQAQMASALPFLKDRPPVICDWLPWNHVFGGSHNVNMMLAHGGSLYIDDGKPTKAKFPRTVENVLSHPGTLAFNVPVGFAMMVEEMERNTALKRAFFGDLDMLFYAGASLPQEVWTRLEEMALEVRGRLPLMNASWGMTETAPATIMVHEPIGRTGVVGVPLPGVEVKLLPDEEMRCELRVSGPNIMPGYWDEAEKTAAAFDEDGYLISGDALRFLDEVDPDRGLVFDGRVSEDFKLLTGTWVQAGTLRLEAIEALRGVASDVVVCGHDRGEIGLFVFPAQGVGEGADVSNGAVMDDRARSAVEERLAEMAQRATGSAKRISRALILAEPPSVEGGEVTDKGSLNVRKIITRRADLLERLYDNEDPALIRV